MTIKRHEVGKIYSQVVEGGGIVCTAGIVADDLALDIKGQTQQVLAKLDKLLAAGGSNKSKVLSATIWVTDIRNRDAMNEAYLKWADPKNMPARACVEAKLADPRMLVEIALIAAK